MYSKVCAILSCLRGVVAITKYIAHCGLSNYQRHIPVDWCSTIPIWYIRDEKYWRKLVYHFDVLDLEFSTYVIVDYDVQVFYKFVRGRNYSRHSSTWCRRKLWWVRTNHSFAKSQLCSASCSNVTALPWRM